MLLCRIMISLLAAMIVSTGTATAQQSAESTDSTARAEIRTVLRAFYFNRAHGNWNSLLIDMLGSKVDANRNAPFEATVADTMSIEVPASCSLTTPPRIDQAVILLKSNWAHVSVRRCGAAATPTDRFRMMRLEGRWRFVDMQLIDPPH